MVGMEAATDRHDVYWGSHGCGGHDAEGHCQCDCCECGEHHPYPDWPDENVLCAAKWPYYGVFGDGTVTRFYGDDVRALGLPHVEDGPDYVVVQE